MGSLTRGVEATLLGEIQGGDFCPVVLVGLDWPDGEILVHSGAGEIPFAVPEFVGGTWGGIGKAGRISVPGEGLGMAATRVVLSILGVPDDLLVEAKAQIRNRTGAIYFGCVTEPGGNVLVGTPIDIFTGYMDALRFVQTDEDGNKRHGLQLELGSGPSARAVATIFHSFEHQDSEFPGDTAGRFLVEIEARAGTLQWPAPS